MVRSIFSNLLAEKRTRLSVLGLALLPVSFVIAAYLFKGQHVVFLELRAIDLGAADRAWFEVSIDILLVVLLGLITFFYSLHAGGMRSFAVVVFLLVAYFGLASWLFGHGHRLGVFYPPFSILLSWMTAFIYKYFQQTRTVHELKQVFTGYRSESWVRKIGKELDVASMEGDKRDVTVIFTDIRGFTSFSEQRDPREVVDRLNEYLSEMVQVIEEFDGYVDKFIGDGIMAYWGAPLAQHDHANLAIACMLAMRSSMERLQAKWLSEGQEPFDIRAGIQSGEVVAGNIGLRGRKMEYTVIGDTVNQAARLEGSAKYYGVNILVGDETFRRTSEVYTFRELDRVRMLGKQVPMTVYELTGPNVGVLSRLHQQFVEGLVVYRAQSWAAAEKSFSAILREFPDDKPSAMYLERCRYFIKNPAASDWDGVFIRNGK